MCLAKTMQIKTTDAGRVLKKLQFELVECDHHVRGFFVLEGKKLFPVHYSFGRKDMPGNISHRFRNSLNLSLEEFAELMRCTLDRQAYLEILRKKGLPGL
jgi:hypothetical protein